MTESELIKQASNWLKDKQILTEARRLIPDGLSESKLANWRRTGRDYPNTFLEGIALSHCARNRMVDPLAVKRAGMSAKHFWQVHVVDNSRDKKGRHQCRAMRYWEGVESLF